MVSGMDIAFFYLDDDIADNQGLLIAPRMIEDVWLPRTARMFAPIRARNIPIALHCCGNLSEVIPLAPRVGVNAIQPLQPNFNDIYAVKRQYGDRLCLIGNLDIAGTLAIGTPNEAAVDTKAHLEELAPGGGYMVAPSHSITPAVPPQNSLAMVEATVRYGRY
jgi:uroporphyrinogen decarboxylase